MNEKLKTYHICWDIEDEGRLFEGIGGITSNGMSKLLMDYPEEQRKDIFNLLFKPKFGASLQHLKVEMGSDVNTSCGTEPSHMRNETDFDITRGYGLEIAKLAKEINPKIYLDCLRWGTPGWIDNHDKKLTFYLNFLKGAKEVFGLDFDYMGPDVNEGEFSRDWTVDTLRPGLDKNGFEAVKLIAADNDKGWNIADEVKEDKELSEALHAMGVHYMQNSTENAVQSGKPLWLSEDLASFRHTFVGGALDVGYRIIKMYAQGRMVKYELHPLIEAEYESTPFNYKGILVASWPWSGHYTIESGLWVIAHFTQFIVPGWKYIDAGCGWDEESGYVTLKSPDESDFSVIIVNKSDYDKQYTFKVPSKWNGYELHVWSTEETEHFVENNKIHVDSDSFTINVKALSVYSITTTKGQTKGIPEKAIPNERQFPLPYTEDFINYSKGTMPLYTSDQGGAFEVAYENGMGMLRQVITRDMRPKDWTYRKTPEPYTLLGSLEWCNYKIEVKFRLDSGSGYVMLGGRINNTDKSDAPPEGYLFYIHSGGEWQLKKSEELLSEGEICNFSASVWHSMALSFQESRISVYYEDRKIASIKDTEKTSGQIALGSGYHEVSLAALKIEPTSEKLDASCLRFDDRDDPIRYSLGWKNQVGSFRDFSRSLKKAEGSNNILEVDFDGTSVHILGKTGPECGIAFAYLDGEFAGVINAYRENVLNRIALFSKWELNPGKHYLKLVTGYRDADTEKGCIFIDAIEITGGKGLIN